MRAPSIAISSTLDRAVAARMREVAGEEIGRAELGALTGGLGGVLP